MYERLAYIEIFVIKIVMLWMILHIKQSIRICRGVSRLYSLTETYLMVTLLKFYLSLLIR